MVTETIVIRKGMAVEEVVVEAKDAVETLEEVIRFLDPGASNHMCGRKEFFSKLDERQLGNITFGDISKRPIEGKGDLLERGYNINIKDSALSIRDKNDRLITHVRMTKNRMFPLKLRVNEANCLKATTSDSSTLWHLRYGHLNFEALKLLEKKNMVMGLPKIEAPSNLCEVQEEKRTKLEDKSQKCIFLGYGENSSGYKLYNPVTRKIATSRDAEFNEEQTWDWKNNDQLKQIALDEGQKNETLGDIEVALSTRRVRIQSDSDGSSSSIVRKTKSIQEIYDSS
ncbi:hypothetical protein CRG98_007620 [Punica granatum]|uniref:Uncharacterized protein n=1 Tax=Punica granatum TaxID=22663 RepID=A0A2I0KU54_PUNGR|nr:hypothetical protein CRG98_007620 [Punica granatum]